MALLRRLFFASCLLGAGPALGCKSKSGPEKDGGMRDARPVPVNPWNTKKVLPPEPEAPPPPPTRK
jgi:hypothetical protein